MAKKAAIVNKSIIDPLFVIPKGAEEQFVYSREGTDIFEGEDFESLDDGVQEEGFDELVSDKLDIPQVFTVVSQVIRRAPGGQQVVDVVLNIEDVTGADAYEVQVVKL